MRSVVPDARIFPLGSEVRRVDEALGDPARFDPGRRLRDAGDRRRPRARRSSPHNLRLLRAYAARLAAVDGVTAVRSPFDALDPDAQTPEELARTAATEPTSTLLARMTHADHSLLVATGAHPWRSAQAADVLEALRAVPHPGLA